MLLADALLSSHWGSEIIFYSQSVRHSPLWLLCWNIQGHQPLLGIYERISMHWVSNWLFYSLFINYGWTNAAALFISILFLLLLSLSFILFIILTLSWYFMSCFCLLLCSTLQRLLYKGSEKTWMMTEVPAAMCIDFRKSTCSAVAQCCNFQNHRANDLHRPNTAFTCTRQTRLWILLYYITLMQGSGWRKGKRHTPVAYDKHQNACRHRLKYFIALTTRIGQSQLLFQIIRHWSPDCTHDQK